MWGREAVEAAEAGRGGQALLALTGAALAVLLALAVGGPSVQAAEAAPCLPLDGPGWRVQDANEERGREGLQGSVEFVTGKPIPYETIRIHGDAKRETESGMFPPTTRQRQVELSWRRDLGGSDAGLTTNRYQVGAQVTATVSCLWFRQWGAARRDGDTAAEAEADRAMATSTHWAILHEMAPEGAFPETIWTLAKEMPSGVWTWDGKTHPLLPKAEALGCARLGLPLLPSKMKAQRERAAAKAVAS